MLAKRLPGFMLQVRTTMDAEIEVHNVISIAGRGAVLIGHLRAGTARVGQVSAPLVLGEGATRRLEVIAVERLSSMQAGGPAVVVVAARARAAHGRGRTRLVPSRPGQ